MQVLDSFVIIKYLNPAWYYNLYPDGGHVIPLCYYNSSVMSLPDNVKESINEDSSYTNRVSRELDLGFQAWNKGAMLSATNISYKDILHKEKPQTLDNYIFIRKYYKAHRVYYYFIKNLLSFHNPFSEFSALIKTRGISKINILEEVCSYDDYKHFHSKVVDSSPLVSVIIPTLSRYEYLKDVLNDLEEQEYKNFEVIIVDQNDNPDKKFYDDYKLNLKLIFQNGKGQWLARNEAIRNSRGEYIIFFDDDSRVDPDWVTQHLKGIEFFDADISAGVSISKVGDSVPANYSFFRWADQFDSGNALVKRKVFEKVGMFDRQFDKQRMGDGEFGLRAYLSGFKSISHPFAKRIHLKTSTGGLRQMGSWDAFRPKKFFSPRPLPSVLYFYRKYFPKSNVINAVIIGILPSLVPYKWKSKKFLYPFAALLSVFLLPVLLMQVGISWSRATKMLKEGDKIEWL